MRAAPELTFLGGTDTVGGVQIVFSGRAGAVVFDLGVVGNPGIVRDVALFHDLLAPRPHRGLADYLRSGMAPLVEGIYDGALLRGTVAELTASLRTKSGMLAGRSILDLRDLETAVFISHLHEDHMALIPYLAPDTRLLMSDHSSALHAALVRAGALAPAGPPVGLSPDDTFCVGDVAATVLPIDHDVPGSAGLLLSCGSTSLAYTGDWRWHGSHPERTARFAQRCRGVDVLLTDSSTTGHDEPSVLAQLREDDVPSWFADVVAGTAGAVYVALHPRNLERQEAIRAVTVGAGRRLALSPATARVWVEVSASLGIVDLAGVHVLVSDEEEVPSPAAPSGIVGRSATLPPVSAADIAHDPSSWVVDLPSPLWPLLLDTAAGPADTFAHMNGPPYGTADPHWSVLATWTRMLGMRFEVASAHGHALPDDLARLVEIIKPGVVVPVHTNAPHRFPDVSVPVRPVARGEVLDLGGLDLRMRASR